MAKRKPTRRHNGEGSIYEDARGLWRAALTYTDPISGVKRRKVVSAKTPERVRERLTSLRRDLDMGITPTKSVTVEQYTATWLTAMRSRVRPASWTVHERHVRAHINPVIGRVDLAKVTPTDVERMTSAVMAKGLSSMTARHARATLRKALADAMRDGLVARNVAALAHPPRLVRREMTALSAPEVKRLLSSSEGDPLCPLWTIAVTSGLRAGELLALRWSDVDFNLQTINVRRAQAKGWDGQWIVSEPKTRASRRSIHLPDMAMAALRAHRSRVNTLRLAAGGAWLDGDLVFCNEVGHNLPTNRLHEWLARALTKAGVSRVRFHDLRHTAATLWLQGGLPLKVVSTQLGHSSIAVTADTYLHVNDAQRQDAAQVMERLLA